MDNIWLCVRAGFVLLIMLLFALWWARYVVRLLEEGWSIFTIVIVTEVLCTVVATVLWLIIAYL